MYTFRPSKLLLSSLVYFLFQYYHTKNVQGLFRDFFYSFLEIVIYTEDFAKIYFHPKF